MIKSILLIIVLYLSVSAVTYGQLTILQQKIPAKCDNASLFVILQQINKYTGLDVILNGNCMRYAAPVSSNEDSLTVEEILHLAFKEQIFTFKIVGQQIIITQKPVKGFVTGLYGMPLEWVNVTLGKRKPVMTNAKGEFMLDSAACEPVINLSRVGYEPFNYIINGDTIIWVRMRIKIDNLDSVSKLINTGFQYLYKGQATGSYAQIQKVLLDRFPATSILPKMEGRAAGLLVNKNRMPGTNLPFISIRGQSTISANTEPLYVVDNLVYYGNIENINPNDIESITVLRDAAATSIWGARAGNGVVVLTTKKGSDQRKPVLELNSSLTLTMKPDLWYLPSLSSKEYIEINKTLFDGGYFDPALNSYALVPPDVVIRQQQKLGNITEKDMESQLDLLRATDARDGLSRLYQPGLTSRSTLSITGGAPNLRYYAGGGFEKEKMAQVNSDRQRATLTGNLAYNKNFYELGVQAFFTDTRSSVHTIPDGLFPYSALVNAAGDPGEVPRDLNDQYKAGVANIVQDWAYRPLQEYRENAISTKGRHTRLTITGKFHFTSNLNVQLIYEYQHGVDKKNDSKGAKSYYSRNLQNRFAVKNGGVAEYLIPLGGILDMETNEYTANKARIQLNYEWSKSRNFRLAALGGVEYGKFRTDSVATRYFGYFGDLNRAISSTKFDKDYPLFYNPFLTDRVPNINHVGTGFDFYPSVFANATFTVWRFYTFSLSGRIDQSNLFGAKTNNQSIPLGSVGFKWNAGDESFYPLSFLPYCTIRASYGLSGNVDKRTTAYTSAVVGPANRYNAIPMSIISPDNPYLRWERSGLFNAGIEFADLMKHVELSVEYYRRKSNFLLAPGAQDPTLGSSYFWGNNAAMEGSGFDVSLATNHVFGKKWRLNTLFLLSKTTNKVTRYDNPYNQAWFYTDPGFLSPNVGASVYSLYAYKWGGLDAAGDPRGYLNGNLSKSYDSIITSPPNSLVRAGSAVPIVFGSFYTSLGYKQFTFSTTLTFKAKYFIRRTSVNYSEPLNVVAAGLNDYATRWQKPGDEKITYVPGVNADFNRNLFYSKAWPLVVKGDQIRLHDASIAYNMPVKTMKKWKLQAMSFYVTGNNLGFLSKAAPGNMDPDCLTGYPEPRSVTVGVKIVY